MYDYPHFDGTQACHNPTPAAASAFSGTIGADPSPALALCSACPFVDECRDWALTHDVYGVWGGTTEDDRADYPAGRAVVDTLSAARTRWTLGTAPAAENHPGPWRAWLGIPDDSVTGLLDLHALLTVGPPLPWLDVLAEDDVWSYGPAQSEHSDGLDWRRPDSTSRAALGLRSRCDAARVRAAARAGDGSQNGRALRLNE